MRRPSSTRRGHALALAARPRPWPAWGTTRLKLPGLAGARPRGRPGLHRAPADLLVGAPDPRAVAGRLDVPRRSTSVQQDVRRRAPPRHARRRRRVLLARPGRLRGRLVPHVAAPRIRPRPRRSPGWCVVATVPAALVGSALEDPIAGAPRGAVADRDPPRRVRAVLYWADRRPDGLGEVSLGGALLVGLAQCLALAPGVSRSGITITAGALPRARPRRRRAPLVPPARADHARRGPVQGRYRRRCSADLPSGTTGPFVVGVLASAGTGLSRSCGCSTTCAATPTRVFVVYRVVVAIAILLVIATGVRSATF